MDTNLYKTELNHDGYYIIPNVYSADEVQQIINAIESVDSSPDTFRKSAHLFAIRQFLKEVPDISHLVFNDKLKQVINEVFGNGFFTVKSIYFDKPGASNWFVAWHQDLTISVKEKIHNEDFGPWTIKHNQFAVQPPLPFLENICTIRIHLDDTDGENGALKVLPGSHHKGIYRPDTINFSKERERSCNVPSGGVMLMKPLLMHSSARSVNNNRRRVIHIEFSNQQLPEGLKWSEIVND